MMEGLLWGRLFQIIKPPLRFFQIKDKLLITHTPVLQNKLFEIVPKLGNDALCFGEFGNFAEAEVFYEE